MRELTKELRKKYSSAINHGFLDPSRPAWHTFVGTWVRKHPGRTTTLTRLRDILGHNPEWEDMTDDTLTDLKDEMLMEMAPNSVRTICAELKAVLNSNKNTKPISSETFNEILRSKKVPTQSVYLTNIELKHLHLYRPRTQREAYVKEIFMRECLTGARSVDSRRLTVANIHKEGGIEYITYVAQKHPIVVTVPVHKWLRDYLHDDWSESLTRLRMDNLTATLQKICCRAGIVDRVTVYKKGQPDSGPKWHFVTSHTGRRTFATILSLKGCNIEQIAEMMGHMNGNVPNISMTANYICARRPMSRSTISLFQ